MGRAAGGESGGFLAWRKACREKKILVVCLFFERKLNPGETYVVGGGNHTEHTKRRGSSLFSINVHN